MQARVWLPVRRAPRLGGGTFAVTCVCIARLAAKKRSSGARVGGGSRLRSHGVGSCGSWVVASDV